MRKYSIPIPSKVCTVCGQSFSIRENEAPLHFNTRKTCSSKCRGIQIARTRTATGVDLPRAQIVCEVCGKAFECRASSRISATGSVKRFCSRSCQGIARRRFDWSYPTPAQDVLVCPICGKEKLIWKNYQTKHCSYVCSALARTQIQERAKPSKPEVAIMDALVEIGVLFDHQRIIHPYVVDFYIPERNLIIECFGDYHHCNPQKYTNGPIDDRQRKSVAKDEKRFAHLQNLGYLTATIWDSEIKHIGAKALLERAIQ